MKDWEDAVAYACTLPDVEMASHWGTLCPKLNGKALFSTGREPGSFCLYVTSAEKQMLLETDPEAFWQTDHYRNYPAVLARFGTGASDRIALYVQRRWWDLAKKPQRIAGGMAERP
jgi:hypothetical protein